MKAQDLRKKLIELWRRRAVTVFTAAVILCAGFAATDWAGAIYILTGGGEDAIVLDGSPTKIPDYAKRILYRSNGTQGYDLVLASGQTVNIHHMGETVTVRSRRETISKMLDRQEIVPGPLEMIGVELGEDAVDITISSDLSYFHRVVEEVAYDTVRRPNPNMEKGTETVVQEGSDGIRAAIYEVSWSNGAELSRQFVEELNSTVVDEIIEYGTADPAQPEEAPVTNDRSPISRVSTNSDGSGTLTLQSGEQLRFREVKSMTATAYTTGYGGVGTRTASGTTVRVGTVAVDRKVIPLGTRLYIVTNDGFVYGLSVAEDTGVRGSKVDLYFNTYDECINFGRRGCTVYVLE